MVTSPYYPDNSFSPGTTYDAIITAPGSDVTLGFGITIDSFTVGAGNTFEALGGSGLTVVGSVSNSGTIMLDSGGPPAGSISIGTGLSGGGTVLMSGGSLVAGMVTSDNTIMGYGAISGNLVNHGTINANVLGATLFFSPSTGPGSTGVKNVGTGAPLSGLIEATGGGTLALGIGTFDNTDPMFPGTISATGGSAVELGSLGGGTTLIKGGTLMTDHGSFIENIAFATLKDLTLAPGTNYFQADGATTNLQGAVTNGGTITVASGGFAPSVLVLDSGDVTLSGAGTIMLEGFAVPFPDPNGVKIWDFAGAGGAGRLTIGAAQTIMGSGQIGSHSTFLSPKLTNHGTITAMPLPGMPHGPPVGITIFPLILPAPPIADAVINDGTMQALDNAFLTFNNGIVTNTGPAGDGTIAAHGMMMPSTLIFQGGVTVNGGIVLVDGPLAQLQVTGVPGGANSIISGAKVSITAAGGTIKLNEGTIHSLSTLTNIAGGMIVTVNGSKKNRLGGIVHNPAGATIKVDTNSNLELETGGTYDNPGMILLNGGPPNHSILRPNGSGAGGSVSLTGGGSVVLGGDFVNNEISGVTGNERLINVDNTISGGGQIGNIFGMLSLTNKSAGTIQATMGTGITIEPNMDGVINGGVIQTMGANLNLTKIAALDVTHGVFTNIDGATKGTIRAAFGNTVYLNGPAPANNAIIDNGFVQVIPGSMLQLSNGTIHNGTLTNFGAGSVIQTDPAVATTNTLGGTVNNNAGAVITVNAGSTLNLETAGTYINAGTIDINAAAGSSLCPSGANGTVTLDGGGTVNLLGAGSSIFGVNATETLLNLNNTIAGGGTIGAGKMALTNRGLINVTDAGGMTIQPNGGGVTNSGTIQANGGGALTLMGGTFTNFEGATNGLIQAVNNGDTINLNGPAANNNAIVDGGNVTILAAGTINLSNGTIHNGTLTNSAAGTILSTAGTTNALGGTVNNPAGGVIAVAANSTLMLETGGTYNNSGTLTITGAAGMPSSLKPDGNGGVVTLTGGGTVTMAGAGPNSIFGVSGNERLVNLNNTINGAGQIGLHLMSLTNDGTINANAAPGITISPNSGGVINGGILQASNGAMLTLDGGIYTNTTGIIQALVLASEVDLKTGVTINGGSLGSAPDGLIRVVDEAVLHTVTNNANLAQNEGSILDLIGTITNNGIIVMPATSFITQIKLLSGDVTLGGSGTVMMKHSTLNQIIAADGLDRLTVGSSQTVRGTGDIGVGMMALTNNGKIIADQPTSLTIHPNASGFLNTSTLQVAAGSTLNVIGGYTQTSGDTNVLGTLSVTAGPLTAGGGTLSGSGMSSISGGFSLTGTFIKKDSGTATISGPQSFSSGTTLAVNGGTVKFNVTTGAVTVGTGVTATVASGATLELAGSISALASGPGRVNITNSSPGAPGPAGVLVSGTNQQVGNIDGSGTTHVNAGSDLTANHIVQSALEIGGSAGSPALVTIDASDASGNPLVQSAAEPSGMALAGSLAPSGPFGADAASSSSMLPPGAERFSGDPIPARALVNGGNPGGNFSLVPEPATILLLALGSLAFLATDLRRRARGR